MKKKIISLINALLIIFSLFSVCNSLNPLTAPKISLNTETEVVNWAEIDGASFYEIKVNDTIYEIESNNFSFSAFSEGDYAFCVRACTLSKKSEYSNILIYSKTSKQVIEQLNVPSPTYNKETKKITWDSVSGANGYFVKINSHTFTVYNTEYSLESFESGFYAYSVCAFNNETQSDYSFLGVADVGSDIKETQTDYVKLINDVATTAMKFNVYIEFSYRSSYFSNASVSTGSGVIIKKMQSETENTYLVVTNNHVVAQKEGYKYFEYKIYDCYSNPLSATLLFADSSKDLALLQVVDTSDLWKNVNVAKVSSKDIESKDEIVSLSQPLSQKNTFTIGEVIEYTQAPSTDSGTLEFQVIKHSAYINRGSSGSALINTNLELVGINYAGSTYVQTGEFINAYAIPVSQLLIFLQENEVVL